MSRRGYQLLNGEQIDLLDLVAQAETRPTLDKDASQTEMERDALRFIADAERRLSEAGARKDDPDTYDRLRADLHSARTAYRAVRMFGPGV